MLEEGLVLEDYDRYIGNLLGKVGPKQREVLVAFDDWNVRRGVGHVTRYHYLCRLRQIGKFFNGAPLTHLRMEDFDRYVVWLRKNRSSQTVCDDTAVLKLFFRFLYGEESKEFRDWKILRAKKREPEILNDGEIQHLIQVAETPYNKALISLLYESACRMGELLNLKVGSLSFHDYGANIRLEGKTGTRVLPLVPSVPALQTFLNHHPNANNPNAPLFYGQNFDKPITRTGIRKKLDALRKKAGIKRRIFPHLIRHTRLTELAKHLTDSELMLFAGHKNRSSVDVYIHLSMRDVKDKLLGYYKVKEVESKEHAVMPLTCPRCQEKNTSLDRFCRKCGLILDEKEAAEMSKKQALLDRFLRWLAEPGHYQKFIRELEEEG